MLIIKTTIKSDNSGSDNVPEQLTFEITNTDFQDVYVLKNNTPLEGLMSDCLDVKRNGIEVLYDGYFLKRGLPSRADYAFLQAGETLSALFNPGKAYDLSQPGRYEITFDQSKLVIIFPGAEKEAFEEMNHVTDPFEVENSGSNFQKDETKPVSSTIGAAMRAAGNKKLPEREFEEAVALKSPVVVGGSTEQKAMLQKAHEKGHAIATTATRELSNNQPYNLWFGAHTSLRANIVKDNYGKIKKKMESTIFTYEIDGTGCADNLFAVTTHGSTTIKLCTLFWNAPAKGFNSQTGTIIHEHSHATAFTADLAIGEQSSKNLAVSNPNQAINNADNYEYFSEALESALGSTEGMHQTTQIKHDDDLPYLNETLNLEDNPNTLSGNEDSREAAACVANPRPWRNWRVAEALKTLLKQVNIAAPNRSRLHDGTIGDAAHQGVTSDHNPWIADQLSGLGVVTALDITHDAANNCNCDELAKALERGKDSRVKYVIWNKKIMSSQPINSIVAWQWRNYTGSNPHDKHIHISLKCTVDKYDAAEDWNLFEPNI